MNDDTRRRTLLRLRSMDYITMTPTGDWQLTEAGRNLLDQLAVLNELARAERKRQTRRRARG